MAQQKKLGYTGLNVSSLSQEKRKKSTKSCYPLALEDKISVLLYNYVTMHQHGAVIRA